MIIAQAVGDIFVIELECIEIYPDLFIVVIL